MSEKGIVVGITSKNISIESYRDKACSLCGQKKGCGNSLWGKLLNHKKVIQIETDEKVKIGDIVNFHYDEKLLLKISLIIYFFPLISLLIFLGLAQYLSDEILFSIFGMIFGLIFGVWSSRMQISAMNTKFDITIKK